MSEDLIQVLEYHFTRVDEALTRIETKIAEFDRGLGRLEHGIARLKVPLADFSAGLDRFEHSLGRIEQRLGLETPTGPDPFAIR